MKKQKLIPLFGKVIISPDTAEEKTKSGIVLPDTAEKEKPHQGEVVAVAKAEKGKSVAVSVGDKVLYPEYGGDEIKINNEEFIIIEENKILAIIK